MGIVITGAGRGIGRSMALALGEHAVDLALAARTRSELESVRDEIRAAGGSAIAVPTDVTDWSDVRALMDRAVEEFGCLDAVVNNAAVASSTLGSEKRRVVDREVELWNRMVDVNLTGVFYGCKAALGHMEAAGRGTVVNVSSGRAHASPKSVYAITKAAMESLTASLAAEYDGTEADIRVLALEPGGPVQTDFGRNEPADLYAQRLEPTIMDEPIVEVLLEGRGANGARILATDPRLGSRDLA